MHFSKTGSFYFAKTGNYHVAVTMEGGVGGEEELDRLLLLYKIAQTS